MNVVETWNTSRSPSSVGGDLAPSTLELRAEIPDSKTATPSTAAFQFVALLKNTDNRQTFENDHWV